MRPPKFANGNHRHAMVCAISAQEDAFAASYQAAI